MWVGCAGHDAEDRPYGGIKEIVVGGGGGEPKDARRMRGGHGGKRLEA